MRVGIRGRYYCAGVFLGMKWYRPSAWRPLFKRLYLCQCCLGIMMVGPFVLWTETYEGEAMTMTDKELKTKGEEFGTQIRELEDAGREVERKAMRLEWKVFIGGLSRDQRFMALEGYTDGYCQE